MRSKKPCAAAKSVLVIFMALLLASHILPAQTQATKFKVLHTFHGKDGAAPTGTLVRDSAGNIYATTSAGGTGGCHGYGCGTVFKMNEVGKEVWLYSFKGTNQIDPAAGLLRDASGNLYGTTENGGKIRKGCGGIQAGGCGTVYKVDKTGKGTVLYKFEGFPSDGYFPETVLVEDAAGDLYGVTNEGGTANFGTVFKLEASGKETILHNFSGPPDGGGDGASPSAGLIRDAVGNLYGVTGGGGAYGAGTVFELDTDGEETLLYSFTGGSDGGGPDSVLIFDPNGNLYGTTKGGGSSYVCDGGCGTVFELSPDNGGWTETALYSFCSLSECADGEEPLAGPLVRDSSGNLYGTTIFGGAYRNCNGDACGVVFKLDPSGKETVLHSFTGGADGAFPYAGLTRDSSGNLYGTAWQGGAKCFTSYTCGVVFKITP
jgi:uncharacterized repeat protein (TIGR03803 family)